MLKDNLDYSEEIKRMAVLAWLPLNKLSGKTVLVTGATGMIGSYMIDVLLECNRNGAGIRIVAVGRSEEKIRARWGECVDYVLWDMRKDTFPKFECCADYIIHLASNTHPKAYVDDAIGTVMMNVGATKYLLDFAAACRARFVYASSVEVYGKNRGDVEFFDESYCGYIDCNTLRAGYPESKRCGEALCQAYHAQKGVDIVIPRLARCYGPTLLKNDTKALSQFLRNAVCGEDIVLKSEGLQHFSYLHASDAVSGILMAMLQGGTGQAYNLADASSDVCLRDLAQLIAGAVGRNVVFDLPSDSERVGFSTATIARLDATRIKKLGWKPYYSIESGISATLSILKDVWSSCNSEMVTK